MIPRERLIEGNCPWSTPSFRDFEPARDLDSVYSLWHVTLPQWAVSLQVFQRVLCAPASDQLHIVAEERGQIVGFIALQLVSTASVDSPAGHVIVLVVVPDARRRGIGTGLYMAAIARFAERGAHRIVLGQCDLRFWSGVPSDLETGVRFFEAQGWTWDHTVVDMVRDGRDFSPSAQVWERAAEQGVTFEILRDEDIPEVLAFEARAFPKWIEGMHRVIGLGDSRDILLVRDAAGAIVGSLTLSTPQSHPERSIIWKEQLGKNTGALGSVGIAEAVRGRGIGTALVARGTQILRERGVRTCFLEWVWAVDFYRRLGYVPWQTYKMSSSLQV